LWLPKAFEYQLGGNPDNLASANLRHALLGQD
jgi:hypothetical protein